MIAWPSLRVVASLGTAQTLAWASSYYLPAILAVPMAHELQVSPAMIFAAFSVALVVSALLGPSAGKMIDRHGGRPVLMGTNLVFALGLAALSRAHGLVGLFAAWAIVGVAMGSGLYEAAFATLVRLQGTAARGSITGITLIAGFASTVGWPLSTVFEAHWGWRGACLGWAALHLVIALPLNASLPRPTTVTAGPRQSADAAEADSGTAPRLLAWKLAFVFAVTWFVSTAMASHLPRLLQASGATLGAAVLAGALVGPAQVGARLLEFGFLRHVHPLLSARLAALAHPLGAIVIGVFGAPAAVAFGVLHGAGNGILTIAKGTLPLALFGPSGYGHRQGVLMVPSRIAQAAAPFAFGYLVDRYQAGALWLSAGLSVAAFAVLLTVRPRGEHAKANEVAIRTA